MIGWLWPVMTKLISLRKRALFKKIGIYLTLLKFMKFYLNNNSLSIHETKDIYDFVVSSFIKRSPGLWWKENSWSYRKGELSFLVFTLFWFIQIWGRHIERHLGHLWPRSIKRIVTEFTGTPTPWPWPFPSFLTAFPAEFHSSFSFWCLGFFRFFLRFLWSFCHW